MYFKFNIQNNILYFKFNMFITAVCVLFLIKLPWPKNKSIYEVNFVSKIALLKTDQLGPIAEYPCIHNNASIILVYTITK